MDVSDTLEGSTPGAEVFTEIPTTFDNLNEVGKIVLYYSPRMKKLTGLGTLVTGPSYESVEKDCLAGEDQRGGLIPLSGEMFELMSNFIHDFCMLVSSANVRDHRWVAVARPMAGSEATQHRA